MLVESVVMLFARLTMLFAKVGSGALRVMMYWVVFEGAWVV